MNQREDGAAGEAQASRFLEDEGYEIVSRNFRTRRGEVDLVARRGRTLCFVEVRMRATRVFGEPAATVTHGKQRRVISAAMSYLARHRIQDMMLRFDVISIVGQGAGSELVHIPNAFDAGA